jgi:hypothetical protein
MSEACPGERSYVGLLRAAGAKGWAGCALLRSALGDDWCARDQGLRGLVSGWRMRVCVPLGELAF